MKQFSFWGPGKAFKEECENYHLYRRGWYGKRLNEESKQIVQMKMNDSSVTTHGTKCLKAA